MKSNSKKTDKFLKLKMFLFKFNYFFIYLVFRPKRIFVTKVARHIFRKTKKPLIYAYNHIGYYDGLTIWNAFITKQIRFIAFKEIGVNRISRFFFNFNGLILIPRDEFGLSSFKTILGAIREGYNIAIAPEGHINREIAFKPLKKGTAKIALFAKTNILPLYFVPNRKIFWQRQHIHVGEVINVDKFSDAETLRNHLQIAMEDLRYKAFFGTNSYVFILPIDPQIRAEDVRFKFYEKYNSIMAADQYHASKSAWYYLDTILRLKFGLILNPEDFAINENGKAIHPDICFNLSHSANAVALIISKDECSIDLEKGSNAEIKAWTKKEANIKYGAMKPLKTKTHKIKFNLDTYYLSYKASGKVIINRSIS